MSDYTPTDGDVREAAAGGLVGDLEDNYEAFDRWLAEVKAAALREAADDIERNALPSVKSGDMHKRIGVMLRARADQIAP